MKIKNRVSILLFTAVFIFIYNIYYNSAFEDAINTHLCTEIKLPIIMYHAFLKDESTHGKYVISPEQFEKDLLYITENGYEPILINQLIDFVNGNAQLPDKPIMITIDDGYYNNYLYAFPLLKKYNVKAVISPIIKYTELYSQHDENNAYYSHITWQQGREMIASELIEFQNHTYDMHSVKDGEHGIKKRNGETVFDYQKRLHADLYKAHNMIKENFGFNPKAIVFPFGYCTNDAKKVIQQMGYDVSISSEEGINIIFQGSSMHYLKRYNRPDGISSEAFFRKILN